MNSEMNVNCEMVFADEKYQIFDLISSEDVNFRQLDSKYVSVDFKAEFENNESVLVLVTNSLNSNPQINVRNMFIPITSNKPISICVYNNSNFKGLSINKGDVIGSILFGF